MKKKIIEELNSDIDILNKENIDFQNNISIKTGHYWAQWGEYQEWIDYNIATIDTIKNLVKENRYRDSYILLRSVFEAYLIIKLAMIGNMYFFDLLPLKGTSKTKKESPTDLLKRATNDPHLINNKNLIRRKLIYTKDKKDYKLRLIFKSTPVQNTSVFVPRHYFFIRDYSSDNQYLCDLIIKNRWIDSETSQIKENKKINKNVRENFFEIGALIDFFKVNKFATPRQADAIFVHYSYLSKFTHNTIESYKLNHSQFRTSDLNKIFKNDFTHELLILLYCNFLSLYFLNLQYKYFSKEPDIGIKQIYKRKLRKIFAANNNKYSFFWFIYNKPYSFDLMLYKYKKRKTNQQKNVVIPYYVNPFVRLRDLRSYWPDYKPPEILSEEI